MTEMDRFEARLAASLERLAEEAPSDVDAQALAATIASSGARRAWWLPTLRVRHLIRLPALQVAFALVAVPLIALGVLSLNEQQAPEPPSPAFHGQLVCGGSSWTSTPPSAALVLDCTSEVSDARVSGAVRMTLEATPPATGVIGRQGQIELSSDGASWAGQLSLVVGPNGFATGDAVLTGHGTADGEVLHLHLMSADGLVWGVVGSVGASE